MGESQKLVVYISDKSKEEQALALSEKLQIPLTTEPGPELSLRVDEKGLSLMGYGLSYGGDFTQMLNRLSKGRLGQEMLVHIAKTKNPKPKAADCTAGMGEDAILLAAAGYEVTMFEQNPVIAALLKDALSRAADHVQLQEIVARMHLIEGNSIELLKEQATSFDLVYLDPMFPARKKSGLIQKKLQLIQKLEQPCTDEAALMEAAMAVHPSKIIVKRPLKGPNLAGRKPSYTSKGKAIRYDCYFGDRSICPPVLNR